MVNHGFSTAALFLVAGFLISRRGSRLIADYGGVQKVGAGAGRHLPGRRACPSLALPGLSTFVSEFLVLVGTFTRYRVAGDHRHGRHRPGRALHPAHVPADDDRARSRPAVEQLPGPARRASCSWSAPLIAVHHRARASTRSRCSTSINPAVDAHAASTSGSTDPAPAVPVDRRRAAEVSGPVTPASAARSRSRRPTIEYADARADADRLRRRGRRRPGRGVRRRAACRYVGAGRRSRSAAPASSALRLVVAARPATQRRRRRWARSPSTARRCSCRARSSLLALVAVLRRRRAARRRRGGRVRRPRPRRCPAATSERTLTQRGLDADRGLPAAHVRGRRHAALPGGQRPADDVRRARGALAAAVPAVRPGPPPPAALAGGRAQVLPARRVLLGVLPLRHRRCSTATPGTVEPRRASPTRSSATAGTATTPAAHRHRAGRGRPAVQGRRGAVPLVDARRLPGRADPDHRRSWPPAPRSPRSARCCASSTSALGGLRWDWQPVMWGVAILTMVVGVGRRAHPDRRQAACSPTPRSRTPASSCVGVVAADATQGGLVERAVLPASPTASRRSARSRSSRWCATRAARRRTCRSGPGWAGARRCVAGGLRALPARLRRHPADQRLHRQVRGLRGGGRTAARAPLVVVGVLAQRDRRVLLRPGHRADVLHRAGRRTARRSRCRACSPTAAHRVWRRPSRSCSASSRSRSSTWPARRPSFVR